ncbi:SoxR reducing system RseC family protein [Fusobacterium sp. PH5-44]|uniref:SoxR reducing system RseC family protein n=1 Tax=unclassified Fusobacterium TaxID=2648384 RepID=UPI003D1E1928
MESKGMVTNINGNHITVKLYKEAACLHCSICKDDKKFSKDFQFVTDQEVAIGDVVTFSIEGSKVAKVAIIVYILPLIGMFLGYFFASSVLKWEEEKSAIMSFAFLAISFVFLFFYDKLYRKKYTNSDIEIIGVEKGNLDDL